MKQKDQHFLLQKSSVIDASRHDFNGMKFHQQAENEPRMQSYSRSTVIVMGLTCFCYVSCIFLFITFMWAKSGDYNFDDEPGLGDEQQRYDFESTGWDTIYYSDYCDESRSCWLHHYTNTGNECSIKIGAFAVRGTHHSDNHEHIAILAELRQCNQPILDANVTVEVVKSAKALQTEETVILQLLDNGSGADVRRDDGIYSRYLTYFRTMWINMAMTVAVTHGTTLSRVQRTAGLSFPFAEYLLSSNFSADNESSYGLPGFSSDGIAGVKAGNFSVGVSGGAIRVDSDRPSNDVMPPNQITDLEVVHTQSVSMVMLTFTAPGDDFDSGKSSRYLVYRSTTRDDISLNQSLPLSSSEFLEGDPNSPSEFGTIERFVIRVPAHSHEMTVSYYFAITAEDDAGNRGDLSVLVQVVFTAGSFPKPSSIAPSEEIRGGTGQPIPVTDPSRTTTETTDMGLTSGLTSTRVTLETMPLVTESRKPTDILPPKPPTMLSCNNICIATIATGTFLFVFVIILTIGFSANNRRRSRKVKNDDIPMRA